jgi:hypothetical protein
VISQRGVRLEKLIVAELVYIFYVSQYVFQQLYNSKRDSSINMILLLHVSTCIGHLQGNCKGKVHPGTGHEGPGGSRGIAVLLL